MSLQVDSSIQLVHPRRRQELEKRTLLQLLERQPKHATALRIPSYHARNSDKPTTATYGELALFVKETSRLNKHYPEIGPDHVVGYVVEEGVNSAVTFISVASQCKAAPLNPNGSYQELAEGIAQLKVQLMLCSKIHEVKVAKAILEARKSVPTVCKDGLSILVPTDSFAGSFSYTKSNVLHKNAGSVRIAGSLNRQSTQIRNSSSPPPPPPLPSSLSSKSKIATHHHTKLPPLKQLQFAATQPLSSKLHKEHNVTIHSFSPRKHTGANEIGLLLRTSGTTSKPKIVPLLLGSIVKNGETLCHTLGLQSTDICINAMPLFHIGGLSASIIGTLASGGSVICMESFTAPSFASELIASSIDKRPTWYSAVPTIHQALMAYVEGNAKVLQGHQLRFIRSGAAPLSHETAKQLEKFWSTRIVPTYSMTEQMPIAQSPLGYKLDRPGSVGLPMTSLLVVNPENCNPLPKLKDTDEITPDLIGEICISGDCVVGGYHENLEANEKSFFNFQNKCYFRTGDMGYIDGEGYLFLGGRLKELIKVGGEQVSPAEVDEVLYKHPKVQIAVTFAIPNDLLGEVTGAAIVLKGNALPSVQEQASLKQEIASLCSDAGFSSFKCPRVYFVRDEQLARGPTRKLLRNKMHAHLETQGLLNRKREEGALTLKSPSNEDKVSNGDDAKAARVNLNATVGIRFILSIIVCFNHIGDHAWIHEGEMKDDHSAWSSSVTSMRVVGDLGVVMFGMLAGFSMCASMNQDVPKGRYMRFYESRLMPIHLIYLISSGFCVINRIFFCRPENFVAYEWGGLAACRATGLQLSYANTWIISLLVLIFCLQAWPIGTLVWQISYYTWFSSAYIFCILCFPYIQRYLSRKVHGTKSLVCTHVSLQLLHLATLIFMEAVYLTNKAQKNYEFMNYFVYSGYMFPPFWAVRFAIGCFVGLHFITYRPDTKPSAWKWGVVCDLCTLAILVNYALMIYFGVGVELRFSNEPEKWSLLEDRMYGGVTPRLAVPFFTLYIYCLAVGKGFFCRLFASKILVRLAPASYSVYLLHQPVFEWYSVLTTGEWWSKRKPFEWFSPDPIVLHWWESLIVIALTVVFALFITKLTDQVLMKRWLSFVRLLTCRNKTALNKHTNRICDVEGGVSSQMKREEFLFALVAEAVEDIVGVRPSQEDHLQDLLASLGIVALGASISARDKTISLKASDLVHCQTVADVVAKIIEKEGGSQEDIVNEVAASATSTSKGDFKTISSCDIPGWKLRLMQMCANMLGIAEYFSPRGSNVYVRNAEMTERGFNQPSPTVKDRDYD